MFERYREKEDLREATFSKGSGYLLYKIVDTNVDASFPMLRKMGIKLDRIEDDIFEGRSSEIVRDISKAKQEIINFRRIVRPQRAVLRDLERTKQRYLQEELEIYFDDISDAAERIWDTLENYKEVVEALESTNESVLSHRLNDSFRILTAASVVLLPLTLIASIFGMNVPVPGEDAGVRVPRDPGADGAAADRPRRLLPAARLAVAGWLSSRRPRSMGDPEAGRDAAGSNGGRLAMPNQKSHRCRARRGPAQAYERHAWAEAYDSLAAADAAGDARRPRTSSGWRSPRTCSGGPTRSRRPAATSPSRGRPNGRRRPGDPLRVRARDGAHPAGRDGPGRRLARPRRAARRRRPAMTGSSLGSC